MGILVFHLGGREADEELRAVAPRAPYPQQQVVGELVPTRSLLPVRGFLAAVRGCDSCPSVPCDFVFIPQDLS